MLAWAATAVGDAATVSPVLGAAITATVVARPCLLWNSHSSRRAAGPAGSRRSTGSVPRSSRGCNAGSTHRARSRTWSWTPPSCVGAPRLHGHRLLRAPDSQRSSSPDDKIPTPPSPSPQAGELTPSC
jgi:hypothetical protein